MSISDLETHFDLFQFLMKSDDIATLCEKQEENSYLKRLFAVLSRSSYESHTEQRQVEQEMEVLMGESQPMIKCALEYTKLKLMSASTSAYISKNSLLDKWKMFIERYDNCILGYYGRAYCSLMKFLDPFAALCDLEVVIEQLKQSALPVTTCAPFLLKADALSMIETEEAVLDVYRDAIDTIDRSAVQDLVRLHVLSAQTFKSLHRMSDAIAECNAIIDLEPNVPEHYNERALIYKHEKEYEKALADLNKMIEIKPHCSEYYLYRYELNAKKLKDYESARRDLEHVIHCDPDSSTAYGLLAQFRLEVLRESPSTEIEELLQKCALLANTSISYYNLAQYYEFSVANMQKAKDCYERATNLQTDDAALLSNLKLKSLIADTQQ